MATNLKFSITVEPVGYGDRWPDYYIKIDERLQDQGTLRDTATYNFDVALQDGLHTIAVGFTNKLDDDTVVTNNEIVADKAVVVKTVNIEGYELADFIYRGRYYPADREPMASNYLSWNGEWRLDITTPIFTWIHETQQLGWIYGKKL
jgi:hypothetical protein